MTAIPPLDGPTSLDAGQAPLFGMFADLVACGLPRTSWSDLYGGFNAGLYDVLTAGTTYDLSAYIDLARRCSGPVLDIACGSGRITLPLAADGHQVYGLDLSGDMLALLRRKLLTQPREVRSRITLIEADMATFRRPERFGLVLIGATSICLLHTSEARRAFFANVRDHLAPGGLFCFDYLLLDEDALRRNPVRVPNVFVSGSAAKRQFTLVGQKYLVDERIELVNFYTEAVDPSGRTDRFVGSTAKAMLRREELVDEVCSAGLTVLEDRGMALGDPMSDAAPRLIVCRAGDDAGRGRSAGRDLVSSTQTAEGDDRTG